MRNLAIFVAIAIVIAPSMASAQRHGGGGGGNRGGGGMNRGSAPVSRPQPNQGHGFNLGNAAPATRQTSSGNRNGTVSGGNRNGTNGNRYNNNGSRNYN